jgi:ABC-type Fe3+/spermidine/putrescine transport system ATPase subunit
LRIVSGFIRQTRGRVLFDGERAHLLPIAAASALYFQSHALSP